MTFKFSVGQAVEYKPTGRQVALFTVIRQMPEEFRAVDHAYRIKSEQEGFERNVLECDLRSASGPPQSCATILPVRWPPTHRNQTWADIDRGTF
jgi:hypothetical protein